MPQAVEEDGQKDNDAERQWVQVWVGIDDNQSILHCLDQHCAERDSGKNMSPAAKQANPAQRGCRDGSEFAVGAKSRRNCAELRDGNQPADRSAKSASQIDKGQYSDAIDAGLLRGFTVGANGIDLTAQLCPL